MDCFMQICRFFVLIVNFVLYINNLYNANFVKFSKKNQKIFQNNVFSKQEKLHFCNFCVLGKAKNEKMKNVALN